MSAVHRPDRIAAAIRSGSPAELPHLLTEAAKAHYGAVSVDLLLLDYQSTSLCGLSDAHEPERVDFSAPGRAFVSQQQLLVEEAGVSRLLCPLTVRGDRLGVLAIGFAEPPDQTVRAEWRQLAESVARETAIAERATDRFRRARRRRRLTLAAEMQWDSLPARSVEMPDYTFCGQLEPAYEVCGDTFDWTTDEAGLTVAVINGSHHGTTAAVLSTFAVAALRNARRSGDDIADQAALASDLLYTEHGGDRQVGLMLLRYEPAAGRIRFVDTGSARAVRLRGTTIENIALTAQPPLGGQEEAGYATEEISAVAGDRIMIVSDGVYAAVDSSRQEYGLASLGRMVRRTRLQPCGEAVRTVIRDVLEHRGTTLDDDAVVTCLDIHPSTPPAEPLPRT